MTLGDYPVLKITSGEEGATCAELVAEHTVTSCGWRITVPAGTITDGASIPRLLWRLCGHPLEVPRVYAAIVHDYLYGGGGPAGMMRKEADKIYRDLLKRYGFGAFKAGVEYHALRLFGASHWVKRD